MAAAERRRSSAHRAKEIVMSTAIADIGIDYPRSGLIRPVSDEERAAYARDGAAVVRGVIPQDWVEFMREAVTRLIEESDPSSQNYADDGDPRFFSLTFPWMFDDAFKAWAIHGPLTEVARQVLTDANKIIFFYDQIFAKEPGATKATPWHQDLPFLPVKGEQQVRIWVPFDTATADGGAVHYLRGSHLWGKIYHPIGFKPLPEIVETYKNSPYEDMPDFEAEYDSYDWLVAEAEPGDLLLHDPRTVHGSRGNRTERYRRAITSFYVGDGATWNPHAANMFRNKNLTGHVTAPDLEVGGSIECDMFPRVWP
jgi:ectoine hydroxylase-related dioxygenase (phytanoyl-CoA dioxygenase family)